MITKQRHNGSTKKRHGPRAKPRRVKSLQKYLRAYGKGAEGVRLRTEFARRIGTSLPYLIAIAWGYRFASARMAVAIERATHGLAPREDLRPDIDWSAFAPRGEPTRAAA